MVVENVVLVEAEMEVAVVMLVEMELAMVEEKSVEMELCAGNKDTCVLEVDDIDDADIVDSLMDAHPPPGFHVVSVCSPVGEDTCQEVRGCVQIT